MPAEVNMGVNPWIVAGVLIALVQLIVMLEMARRR